MFFSDADRRKFIDLVHSYAVRHDSEVLAYCLMTNHVHLVMVPKQQTSLASILKPANRLYSRYVNLIQGWCGRLWQERFYSCPMDAAHTLIAVRYVEQNPVRAGLVSKAENYLWSSAAGHAGRRVDPMLSDRHGWLESVGNWAEWLHEQEDSQTLERLRYCTRTGHPLGTAAFVETLEVNLNRPLQARPRGRPAAGHTENV